MRLIGRALGVGTLGAATALAAVAGPAVAAGTPGGGRFIRAAGPPGVRAATNGPTALYSSNWSGYAQGKTSGARSGVFTAVRGYWTITKVTSAGGNPSYSSDWVGVDGFSNSKLVQDGTEADWAGGKAHYDAWTETLPAAEVVAPLTVTAGNKMEGIVQETARNKWAMTVKNLTTGKSYTKTVSYSTPEASAEVIHERPEVGGSLARLARTGNVTFSPGDYSEAAPGAAPAWKAMEAPVSGETVYRLFMTNNADTAVIASPSLPNSARDGFTVADGATVPPPPR